MKPRTREAGVGHESSRPHRHLPQQLDGLLHQLKAGHGWYALVGDQHRNRLVSEHRNGFLGIAGCQNLNGLTVK